MQMPSVSFVIFSRYFWYDYCEFSLVDHMAFGDFLVFVDNYVVPCLLVIS
jgi:hypothetical protein